MLDAQRETYGDGLDPTQLHPYMWAVKGHYYSTGRSFYNFPYMFGLLFGLGLYARYQRRPGRLHAPATTTCCPSTGLADAADAGRPLRHRHPHARLLARQPRHHPRRYRPVRGVDWQRQLTTSDCACA